MLILFIQSLIIFIIILCYRYYTYTEEFVNYYKCLKYRPNNVTNDIFNTNDIKRNNNINADIYIPCGYTFVEQELLKYNTNNTNQKIFAIPGCDIFVSKNGLWDLVKNEYGKNVAKSLLPETYICNNKDDIQKFINDFNPKQIYLLKQNIQQKKGIKISNNLIEILKLYKKKYVVIQKYINNLFLVNNRKINLRLYVLIVCQNNYKKFYLHKQGKCLYTNKDYKENNITDNEYHLTSLNLDNKVYDNRPLSLNELLIYLGKDNYIKLFNRIHKNLIYVLKSIKPHICDLKHLQKNIKFQLFGLDYIFTNNYKPYLLEFNKGPDMSYKNKKDKKIKYKVINDSLQVVNILPFQKGNEFQILDI